MADNEKRDWLEDIRNARMKALSEMQDLVNEIRPKVQQFVEKARSVNLRDEAEDLLDKLKNMTSEFSKKEEATPKASQTKKTSGGSTAKKPVYILPDGTERYRLDKWAEGYSKKEVEAMKKKAKEQNAT
ncbi:hypothetical protein EF888_15120 [Silicimonas algicola]|uniref:Uncharacterized protein n=1 Tax=Silicimonas algicola TaxID=1826607 RepID=A0A316FXU4_9RHOB|nr:hypothetical protein [Silicimonas algicola]AZQ68345.1 hypothetical protein EF888_15120 [Silicimonas algicola]PWK53584.1 hypothetical protein C8D95_113109 [Silicimonas algicola]